jgi:hypothetical protein
MVHWWVLVHCAWAAEFEHVTHGWLIMCNSCHKPKHFRASALTEAGFIYQKQHLKQF